MVDKEFPLPLPWKCLQNTGYLLSCRFAPFFPPLLLERGRLACSPPEVLTHQFSGSLDPEVMASSGAGRPRFFDFLPTGPGQFLSSCFSGSRPGTPPPLLSLLASCSRRCLAWPDLVLFFLPPHRVFDPPFCCHFAYVKVVTPTILFGMMRAFLPFFFPGTFLEVPCFTPRTRFGVPLGTLC